MTDFKSAAVFTVLGVLLASLPGPLRAAPDNTQGMALMSATVNNTTTPPTLVRGSGAVSVSRPTTGIAHVVFDRDLSNCSCTTSVGSHQIGAYTPGTYFSTTNCPFAANSARIATKNESYTLVNVSFHLIVFCPK